MVRITGKIPIIIEGGKRQETQREEGAQLSRTSSTDYVLVQGLNKCTNSIQDVIISRRPEVISTYMPIFKSIFDSYYDQLAEINKYIDNQLDALVTAANKNKEAIKTEQKIEDILRKLTNIITVINQSKEDQQSTNAMRHVIQINRALIVLVDKLISQSKARGRAQEIKDSIESLKNVLIEITQEVVQIVDYAQPHN